MKKTGYEVNVIGTRHGEKLFEVLCSREEMFIAQDQGDYYRIQPDNRDLNYFNIRMKVKICLPLKIIISQYTPFDVKGMEALLLKLKFMRKLKSGDLNDVRMY